MKLALISGLAAGAVALSSANEVTLCQDNDELLVRSVSASTSDGHLKLDISADKLPVDTLAKVYVKVLGIPVVEAEIESYNPNMSKDTPLELDLLLPLEVPSYIPLDVEVRLTRTGESHVASCVAATVEPSKVTAGATLMTSRFGISAAHVKYLFGKWMVRFEHELPVAMDDIETRFEVFRQNLLRVLFHNQGDNTYTMSMNQFGHMTPEEFSESMLGFKAPMDKVASALRGEAPRAVHKHDGVSELPETVDWSTKGAVTDVKNQGACGSCWSFSATGALEGAYFLKYGKLVSFSEEQLVTCDHVDMGCNGGLMDNAFKFIEEKGGLCSEDEYPYVSGSGKLPACKVCTTVENSAPKSYTDVAHDEESLMSAVAQQPVAIAIEADQFAFQFYSGGVLTGRCGARLDHGVLVVGYGTLKNTKYWKVKNSWGATWGMDGYINIQREKNVSGGECGILESASYPVM